MTLPPLQLDSERRYLRANVHATGRGNVGCRAEPCGPAVGASHRRTFPRSVSFGVGPNDQALNVQTTYWTSASGTDFNFFYGYPGSEDPANTFSAWAVEGPEPSSLAMTLLAALATACFLHRPISKRLR